MNERSGKGLFLCGIRQWAGSVLLIVLLGGTARAADLSISGSTMLYPLEKVWYKEYGKDHPGVSISVAQTGSGSGISNAADGNLSIGASDAYLTRELKKQYSNLVFIPIAMDASVVIENVPGLPPSAVLRMDGPTLAKMFMGKIIFWNDPAILTLNRGISLPHLRIAVIHRADASGTTFVFTNYLNQTSRVWNESVGRDRSPAWPAGRGVDGSVNLVKAVRATPGAIGYVGLGWAVRSHLWTMALKNRDGSFVRGSVETIQAAGIASLRDPSFPDDFNRTIVWKLRGKNVYPDANFEFWVVNENLPGSTMKEVTNLIEWVLTTGQRSEYTVRNGFVPLPFAPLRPRLSRILNRLLPGNTFKIISPG